MSKFISAQTAAVAASQTTELTVKQGDFKTITYTGTLGSGEEIEIKKKLSDGSYRAEADPDDTVNTSKKIITSARSSIQLRGPFTGAISKTFTVAAVGVDVE